MHAGIQFKNTYSLTRSLNSFVVLTMTPDTLKDSRYELLELIFLNNGKDDRVNQKEPSVLDLTRREGRRTCV